MTGKSDLPKKRTGTWQGKICPKSLLRFARKTSKNRLSVDFFPQTPASSLTIGIFRHQAQKSTNTTGQL
jgi:hypothetical protein